MRCSNCGADLPDNTKFCGRCGAAAQVGAKTQQKPKKPFFKRTAVRVTAVVLAVLFVLSSVTVVLFATGVLPFGKKNGGQGEIDGRLSFKEFEEADIAFDGAFGYVKEQLALTADEKYSYDDVEKAVKENGGEIVGCIEFTNDYQLEFSGTDYDGLLEKKEKVAAALENSDVQLHRVLKLSLDDNTKNSAKGGNWWRKAIRLDELEKEDRTYQNVKVGLYDTCFVTDNADLAYAFDRGETFYNSLPREKDKKQYEISLLHGTSVSGFLAAKKGNDEGIDGVANNVSLYGFSQGSSFFHHYVSVLQYKHALATLLSKGCKVINLSNGYSDLSIGAQVGIKDYVDALKFGSYSLEVFLKKFIDAKREFVIVKAAGNMNNEEWYYITDENGEETIVSEKPEDSTIKPLTNNFDAYYDLFANISNASVKERIIVVGSVNQDFNRSNHSLNGDRVDIYAPGYDLKNIFGQTGKCGTSYSTPIVSGTVALMLGVNPDIPSEKIKKMIIDSSSLNVNDENKKVLDAYAAVSAAGKYTRVIGSTEQVNTVMGAIQKMEKGELKDLNEPAIVDIFLPNGKEPHFSKQTDESGGFTIMNLKPGDYEISAESRNGFWRSERSYFTLEENGVVYIDDVFLESPTLEILSEKTVKQVRDYMGNNFKVEYGGRIRKHIDGNVCFYNDNKLKDFSFFVEKANNDYWDLIVNSTRNEACNAIKQKFKNGDYDNEPLRISAANDALYNRQTSAGQKYSVLNEKLKLGEAKVTAGIAHIVQNIDEHAESIETAFIHYEVLKEFTSRSGQVISASELSSANPKCALIEAEQSVEYVKAHPPRVIENIEQEPGGSGSGNSAAEAAWKQAYRNYIDGLSDGSYRKYALADVDGDGVPELFCPGVTKAAGTKVCTFVNGAVTEQQLGPGYSYIPDDSLIISGHMQSGMSVFSVYTLSNGVFTQTESGKANEHTVGSYSYQWNGADVTKDQYEDNKKSYTDRAVTPEAFEENDILDQIDEF